jgi:hypothetical protein
VKKILIVVLIVVLIACTPQSVSTPQPTPTTLPSTASEAQDVLIQFLTLLHTGDYAAAAPLYAGDYETLSVFNPEIDPSDRVALWTWVCENKLLQCLEVRSFVFKELRGDSYVFQVEFSNPDGSLFVLGPCCGADETEMPHVSQFEFTVSRTTDGRFVVMNTPPYVP